MKSLSTGLKATALALSLAGCNREVGVPTADANEMIITLSPEGVDLVDYMLPTQSYPELVENNVPNIANTATETRGRLLTVVVDDAYIEAHGMPMDEDSAYITHKELVQCDEITNQVISFAELEFAVNNCIQVENFEGARQFIDQFIVHHASDFSSETQQLLLNVNQAEQSAE